jgi:hypothetical protein
VRDGTAFSAEELERSSTAAARRVHQGIPLEAFLHAFRLWSQIFWEQVLAEARTDRPGEQAAALQGHSAPPGIAPGAKAITGVR